MHTKIVRKLSIFSVLIFFLLFFLQTPFIFNQKSLATGIPIPIPKTTCTCQHPGINGNGNNGWTCANGTKGACSHKEEACLPNDTNGITCKNDIICGCSTDGKKVICDSPGAGSHAEDNCSLTENKVCLQGAKFTYHVFGGQTVIGADCQRACTCQHPGTSGQNMNGWTCSYGGGGACSHKEEACINDPASPGGVACKTDITCGCSTDKRTVVCNSPGTKQHQDFPCGSNKKCVLSSTAKHTVFDQTVYGADCLNNPQPAPPAPPCAPGATVNGKCTAILTSFGTIQTDPGAFISRLFGILLGASGGIALLLIMRAGYRIMTSRGNPEGLQQGREQLIAAIVGLLFLVFSFVLLEVIGVDLLRIPGFTGTGGGSGAGAKIPAGGTCDVNLQNCATGLTCNYVGAQGQCQ